MYVKPYIDYYIQFHSTRDYFECHEILEEYWKKDTSPDRDGWVLLIQLAVGLYHQRRNNFTGANKMITSVFNQLPIYEQKLNTLGIDYNTFYTTITKLLENINRNSPYESIIIPLKDINLIEYLYLQTELMHQPLYCKSNIENTYLLHKHIKRDRTDVLTERLYQLEKRKTERT